MDIRIQAKNIDLNPHAEQYIQKKFDRLRRHLPNLDDAKMEVSRTQARATRDRVEAQMTLNIAGYTLRGQDRGVNLFAAVDAVTDVVDRQIRRFKGKVYHSSQARKSGRGIRDIPPEAIIEIPDAAEEQESLEEIGQVVRTKRHSKCRLCRSRTPFSRWRCSATPSSCSSTWTPMSTTSPTDAATATTA